MFSNKELKLCRKCLEERTTIAPIEYVRDDNGLAQKDENGQFMRVCSGCGDVNPNECITEQAILFILWTFAASTNEELLAKVVKFASEAMEAANGKRSEAEAKNPRLRLANMLRGVLGT